MAELAACAGRIKTVRSHLSGRKFILYTVKASTWDNLRRGHEALLKIQVPGPHFKISFPLHNAISGPAVLPDRRLIREGHSHALSNRDRARWYMYNRKKQFPFRRLTLRLLKLVCPVQHEAGIVSYTDDRRNRLNFLLKLRAAPVRRVHYNLRPSGRASDLPHGLVPCADTTRGTRVTC